MPRSPEARALPLIELIYQAAVRSEGWQGFLEALSAELGGPAIAMTLGLPETNGSLEAFRVHTDEHYSRVFADYASRGALPWSMDDVSTERFQSSDELGADVDLSATDFYRDYMQPQGLVPEGPIGHVFGEFEGRVMACLGLYRRDGGPAMGDDGLATLDRLVPHLRQAYRIHRELHGHRQRSDAVAEVMDRFPTGAILVDAAGRSVGSNRAARRILAAKDGLVLEAGVVRATSARSRAGFLRLVDGAVAGRSEPGLTAEEVFSLSRPSGRRPYAVLATSLMAAPQSGFSRGAVAVLFVADPEERHLGMRELLASLYGLTAAEAELAALVCEGESVESAAEIRGVTLNTARGQLKQVFAKTGTRRQSDLVRLALSSVAALEGQTAVEKRGGGPIRGQAAGLSRRPRARARS